jgi:WD40 repeat protein
MASVFISYSRKDQPFVRRLFAALEADGREAWVDWEGIPPSAEWLAEIYTAIDAANTFVFVLSPDSLASNVCASEVTYAMESRKRIIPLLCRDVSVSAVRSVEKLAQLASLNWIGFRESDDFDWAFSQLRFALDTDLDYWHLASDLLVRAKKWQAGKRNPNLTLRGPELAAAERWVTTGLDKVPRPTLLQLEYISASRKDATRRQRRRLAGVSVALIITLVLAAVSSLLFQQTRTQNAQLVAQNAQLLARALAGSANEALADNRIDQALLLGTEAMQRQPADPETRNALFNALEYSPYLETVLNGDTTRTDTGLAVSFDSTGRVLMLATKSGQITLWDVTTGRQLSRFRGAYQGCASYYDAALSPDGRTVATLAQSTCSQAGVDLWDAVTGAHRLHLQPGSTLARSATMGLEFTPDGKKIAVIENGGIGIWDIASAKRVQVVPLTPNALFPWVTISPDGSTLAAGDYQYGDNVMWNLLAGRPIRSFSLGAEGAFGAAFSPDGKTLALAVRGTHIQFMDVATGAPADPDIVQNTSGITSLAYSLDGARLIFNDEGTNGVHLWNLRTHAAFTAPLQGHTEAVRRVAVSPDGHHFATVGNDNKTLLWRFAPSSARSLQYGPHLDGFSPVAISADGTRMATCNGVDPSSIVLWDAHTASVQTLLKGTISCGNSIRVGNALAFSPDGDMLAVSDGWRVQVWNVKPSSSPGHLLTTLIIGQQFVRSVVFSPNGLFLAVCVTDGSTKSPTGTAAIWEATSWTLLSTFDKVNDVAFSPDSQTLALAVEGDKQGEIHFWNLASHSFTSPLVGSASDMQGVAYSPDGRTLASIDNTGTVNFWDVRTGTTNTQASFVGATGSNTQNYGIIYSPDGKTVAAFDELTIVLWDTRTRQQLVRPIFDPQSFNNVQFSPDGQFLAESESGGPVILRFVTAAGWMAEACHVANRNLTQSEWKHFIGDEPYQKTCPNLPSGE